MHLQLQFEKQGISCLHTVKRELQSQEQTQEVRISDGMPDIGNIISTSGQVILRSKEWKSDGIAVTGGTMVWIQYAPEEGGPTQYMETWLPFQMNWPFAQIHNDGTIFVKPCLCCVDARIVSSRKMMVRTNVSVLGWAMERRETSCGVPTDVPEDVYLRREVYPMELPVEAGEKSFTLEETLNLPASSPDLERPVSFSLQPQITEERMMGDKIVFRGNAVLHMHYLGEDGSQHSWDFEIPFTQYSELDAEYDDDARPMIWPCVTALEIDREGENLNVKAGLVCQYRISARRMVELVTDAYSPRRSVIPSYEALELPAILEFKTQPIHAQQNISVDGMRLAEVQFLPQPVRVEHQQEEARLTIPGQFQMLYYDMEGNLKSASVKWEERHAVPCSEGVAIEATLWPGGKTQGNLMSGSANLTGEWMLSTETYSKSAISMVSGLELGELRQLDPQRPSLILRRSGGKTLWDLAKCSGSSVEAIREANQLEAEPEESQMLLIPVI